MRCTATGLTDFIVLKRVVVQSVPEIKATRLRAQDGGGTVADGVGC
jgi:hypothetical protein